MPRLNFILLLIVAVGSFVCYQQADSAHRTRYGRQFATFAKVMGEIEERYVQPVDRRELFEAALRGMTDRLDRYSAYIPPERYAQLQENLDQKFGGIGVQVILDSETERLTVSTPLVGSPAFEAGMRAGDQILEIEGQSTEGFGLVDAVGLIKGDPGTTVRLTVLHEGDEEPVEIEVRRAIINVETVLGDRHNPDGTWNFLLEAAQEEHGLRVGYIRLTGFSDNTTSELKSALDWLTERDMQGLILDLRFNPGGLLRASAEVCDLFIEGGVIVSTRGRDGGQNKVYTASPGGTYTGFPMTVLINDKSASASEIVAACLQDHGRANVVGQRSYGKGSVQDVIELENGVSALKLTIASYWRPSGTNIHRFHDDDEDDQWGVRPNPGYEVELEGEEFEKAVLYRRDRDVFRPGEAIEDEVYLDPQLRRALEAVMEQIQTQPPAARAA